MNKKWRRRRALAVETCRRFAGFNRAALVLQYVHTLRIPMPLITVGGATLVSCKTLRGCTTGHSMRLAQPQAVQTNHTNRKRANENHTLKPSVRLSSFPLSARPKHFTIRIAPSPLSFPPFPFHPLLIEFLAATAIPHRPSGLHSFRCRQATSSLSSHPRLYLTLAPHRGI